MATRPTQSLSGWAASGTIATSIPPAEVALGQQAGNPIPAAWINLFGSWLGYFDDLSPADEVLAFREWECPDDSSYDIAWDGPAGTDGRLDATVERLLLSADTSVGLIVPSGSDAITLTMSASFGGFLTDAAGSSLGLTADNPTSPGNTAGIEVDADSGDVTLFSDYGDVLLPPDVQTSSGVSYINVLVPWAAFTKVSTAAATVATVANRPDIVINGNGTAETIGFFDLGQSTHANTSPATQDTIVSASFEHSLVTGVAGGQLTFSLVRLDPDGTITAVSGGSVTLSVGDSGDTLVILAAPEVLTGTQRLLCRVSSNILTVSVTIFGVSADFSSTHLR